MTETTREAWRRKGYDVVNGQLARMNLGGAVATDSLKPGAPSAIIIQQLMRNGSGSRPAESSLERKFDQWWALIKGPPLVKEHKCIQKRKFRFDRVHLESKTAIELHGGIFQQGRHNRGTGFRNDRKKMNLAQMNGWKVFELTEVTVEQCQEIKGYIETLTGKMEGKGAS